MSELKDSAIKLFGQMIPLPVLKFQQQQQPQQTFANEQSVSSAADDDHEGYCDRDHDPEASLREEKQQQKQQEEDMEHSGKQIIDDEQEDGSSKLIKEDLKDPAASSGNSNNPKTPPVDRKKTLNGEQSESSTSQQEKTLKKPDKILPCPRCNSMDTKFCYYNNYNVNQPRHFCKNCQRYWTAGGTTRNMPVGAGRRKNKSSSASNYRQIMISEALRIVQANGSSGVHSPSFANNGTVLTFGSDSPLCESVASVWNLSDKSQNCVRNGFHRPEPRILVPGTDNGDDHSSGSSITVSNSSEKGGNCASQDVRIKYYQGSAPQVPYFPGPPWSHPWNTPMPPPGFYPSGFPVSFYPEITYWGCAVPGHWNMPCLPPNASSQSQYAPNFTPAITTLGKHSRDGNIITQANLEKEEPSRGSNNSERPVLVPKTLRIDDPIEAAKSSIWATLGIKNERTSSGEGLFKGFQSKINDRNYIAETSAVLQANPAAFSRSLNFHERT